MRDGSAPAAPFALWAVEESPVAQASRLGGERAEAQPMDASSVLCVVCRSHPRPDATPRDAPLCPFAFYATVTRNLSNSILSKLGDSNEVLTTVQRASACRGSKTDASGEGGGKEQWDTRPHNRTRKPLIVCS